MATHTMMPDMTDEQFQKSTFELIRREYGLGGLARFLSLNYSGKGDYTVDRDTLLADVSIESAWQELKSKDLTRE
ncbi:MAG: hypothetical protein PW792_16485 [Acidobacteriaceae bacterium]|nr:hypothetical protein [Acidobacteriaceae bacterium]